ncbi:MAG TPA: mannosyltransferase family protein [Chthoniobacterales bacterium]|nr:mannosyltransferase family protein [Chthoniobacterales bacterium]
MKSSSFAQQKHRGPEDDRRDLIGRIRRWDWDTVALVLGIKVLLLTFGVQAVAAMRPVHNGWFEIWNNWDARHYLRLAEQGYTAAGEGRVSLVFFPLYPWFVRLTAFFARDYLVSAFIVSGFASIAAALILRRLARCDESEAVSRNAVWFLFIFPTSFFLHIGYTESLFLALTLGCFLAARKERWAIAGLLGAGACLTRVNGLILLPALTAEVALQYWQTRRISLRWLWLGLVPFGFLGYLWLNHEVTGDFFAFRKIMEEHWYKKFASPWFGIHDVYLRALGMNINEGLNEFLAVILISVCTIWSWVRLRPSYSIWITLNWLLINSTAYVLSVPRYTLTLFPVFLLFAKACTGRRFWFAMLTVWSLLYLALYTGRFAQGLWAF